MKNKQQTPRYVMSPGIFSVMMMCGLCITLYLFVNVLSVVPFLNHDTDRSAHYNVKVLPALNEVDMEQLPPDTYSYLAMIDAGSSGCRVHVYRYGKLGDINGPLYVLPKHISMKVKPGLSSFAKNPEAAGPSLEQLIEFLKKNVPPESWTDTPIWLKATAGLRLVKDTESEAILRSVRDYLTNQSPFLFRNSYAKVISGKEEGAFGWIAYNYLQKIIGPKSDVDSSGQAIAPRFPYTVVEMGGASSQVTQRVPLDDINRHMDKSVRDEHYYTMTIEKEQYHLYTFSYLGYGAEQSREKLNTMLQNNEIIESTTPAADSIIHDPCLNNGFLREINTPRGGVYEGSESVSYAVHGASVSQTSTSGELCYGAVMEFLNNNPPSSLVGHECNGPHKNLNLPHSFDCV